MAHTPRTVPINVLLDRITPDYRQVVFQFSIINLTNRIKKGNLSTLPKLTTCHKWHHTTSHCLSTFPQNLHHEECPRQNFFSEYLRYLTIKFLIALSRFGKWHSHASVKNNLRSLTKYNQVFMLSSSIFKRRKCVARKGNEVLTLFERMYPSNLPGRHTVNSVLHRLKTSIGFK